MVSAAHNTTVTVFQIYQTATEDVLRIYKYSSKYKLRKLLIEITNKCCHVP